MKRDILKFVKKLKRLLLIFDAVVLIVSAFFMFSALFAARIYFVPFGIGMAVFVAVLAFYLAGVKYALVYDMNVADSTVSLRVKGGLYTYSFGEVRRVLYDDRKFIVYFSKGGAKAKFVFLRRVPFDRFRAEQFTKDDIASFFPCIAEK